MMLPSTLAERSFLEVTTQRLDALWHAAGFTDRGRSQASRVLHELLSPWGHSSIGTRPRRPSDISDDNFPVELSLALTRAAPEVRVLFEAQADDEGMTALWRSGQRVNARLEQLGGASLHRLRTIEELFEPTSTDARWAMWHAVGFSADGNPKFKVYLNPCAKGKHRAVSLVAEAVNRLGFSQEAEAVTARTRESDELKFFSLDLDSSPEARVKVYRVHPGATRADIEVELRRASNYDPEAFDNFWTAIATCNGPFRGLPISTYLALTSAEGRVTGSTVHFPIRDYAPHDADVRERLLRLLKGPDQNTYERALYGIATRALEAGTGLHSYVAIHPKRQNVRVTVYMAIEAYRVGAPRVPQPRPPAASTADLFLHAPRFDGELLRDPTSLRMASGDFGGLVRASPIAVLKPKSDNDICCAIRHCRARGISVTARGQGHTTYGHSLVEGGLVIDMAPLGSIFQVEQTHAVVGAGLTWRRLIEETMKRRLAPPVLTSFQGLSVGGTLSVGGLGFASFDRGAQVDHVLNLEVVTGNGELVRCSAKENPELFKAILAGLGQCGIITRATISLSPAKRFVRHQTRTHYNLGTFIGDLRELATRVEYDGLSGTIAVSDAQQRFIINLYQFVDHPSLCAPNWDEKEGTAAGEETTEVDYLTFCLRVDVEVENARRAGLWDDFAHPWFDAFLPDRDVGPFLAETLPEFESNDLGPTALGESGQIHVFPLRTSRMQQPLLRVPDTDVAFLVDILTSAHSPGHNPAYARSMLLRNRRLFERAVSHGGTRYTNSAVPFSTSDWRRHFGPAYAAFAAQKRIHDPDNVLSRALDIFGT